MKELDINSMKLNKMYFHYHLLVYEKTTETSPHKYIKINFIWIDWSYNVNRNDCWRAPKRVMKLSMATHFARMQQLDEFPSLQRNSPFKRYHELNVHNVDKLPLSWQRLIKKEIINLKKNMPTCIEE